MKLISRVSARIENEDRAYEFTFPNGAPASEVLQSLSDIHKHVVETAQEQSKDAQDQEESNQDNNKSQSND